MRLFAAKSPTVIEFVLIEEGPWHESKRGPNGNRVYMTAEQVRASVGLFNGLPVQAIDRKANVFDHMPSQAKNELSAEGARFLLKDVVGFIREPRAETLPTGKLAVVAPIHFHDERVATTLRAAVESGDLGFTGGSIDGTPSRWDNQLIDGTPYDTVWLGQLDTWDLATFPAAGGRMLRLAASRSINNNGERQMTAKQKATLTTLLSAAGVKGDALEKVFADGADFGKESFGAIRAALAGKDDLLKQFDALAEKMEKGEEVSFDELIAKITTKEPEAPKAEVKPEPTTENKPSEDPAVKRAEELLAKAQETHAAVEAKLGEAEIETRVNASRLPDKAKDKLKAELKLRKEYNGERINASIDGEAKYLSAISGDKFVNGGRVSASFEMGDNEVDNLLLQTQAMLSMRPVHNAKKERIEPFRSFQELHRITASADEKYNPEKFFRKIALGLSRGFEASDYIDMNTGRVTAALTTSDLAEVFGTAMQRAMLNEYNLSDFNVWRKIVQVESLTDLRTKYFSRLGGYAAAPVVSEGGTYTEASSPTDEHVGLTIYKYGHIESITEEMVINDDVRAVQRITKALGIGMSIDVYRMVFDIITNNDAVAYGSDTDTLVHASSHANGAASSGTALSDATFKTGYDAMVAQSAYNNSRAYLNNKPRYIICGYKQARTAELIANPVVLAQIAATSGEYPAGSMLPGTGLPNPFGLATGAVISLPHVSSTVSWWIVADPMELPVILVGFHNGKDTPEVVTEAANTGSNFTADKIRLKTKMRRGAVINDHRAIYGQLQ